LQYGGVVAASYDMSAHTHPYAEKRDMIYSGLKDSFELVKPTGAFYAFPKAPDGETGTQFVERAIKAGVLVVPGIACSRQDTHFRISYAADDEKLARGIDILNSLV
jgi:aspartate aminotransferase/aminotransferase